MKRLYQFFLLLLALLLPATATAYDFEVDGIYYNIINENEAAVAPREYYEYPIGDGNYGYEAYSDYSGEVTIPESVTYNGNTYPITSIDNYAFFYCYGLSSINIPCSITTIGKCAFNSCTGLTVINIPKSVTSISDYAFSGCRSVTIINVDSDNCYYDSRNNCNAIIETASNTLIMGCMTTVIPNTVTTIANSAFSDCSGLTNVNIPNSVTFIGDRAFYGCSGLTSITIPNSVTSIGNAVFESCSGLTSVTISTTITSIGNYAFYGCSRLTSVTMPTSVTSIGTSAFYGCSRLTSVNISDIASWCNISFANQESNPLSYASHLYLNGTEITNLIIPNSVTSIGNNAFCGCSGLTSVTIPNSVTSIGDYAFYRCSGLTGVTIPCAVTFIGCKAFRECESLTAINYNAVSCADFTSSASSPFAGENIWSINIGDSVQYVPAFLISAYNIDITIGKAVTSIAEYAFSCELTPRLEWNAIKCSSMGGIPSSTILEVAIGPEVELIPDYFVQNSYISSVSIPNSVRTIGQQAFANCGSLRNVSISNSINEIGNSAFSGCSCLKRVDITDITAWCGISFSNSSANPLFNAQHLFLNDNEVTNLDIPNSVSSIGNYAFCGGTGLTSLTIPNSVTTIGDYAFSGCSGLTGELTIPNSVTTIGNSAFSGCSGLTGELTIPNLVTSIGNSAFSGCYGLTSMTMGNSVASIGDYAFYNCTGLIDDLALPNSVISIGDYAFYGCSGLTGELTIPNSVTTIGNNAFYGCSELTNITIGSSVTEIGYSAFRGCSGLIGDLTIPNSVTNIGDYAFYGCSGLTGELTIPNSVTTIGNNAFYGCTGITQLTWNAVNCSFNGNLPTLNITQVTIGNQVTVLPDAFVRDSKITEVSIPNTVTYIGSSAFSGCSGLTGELAIPNSVTTIGGSAFYGCSGLTGELTIPITVTYIGNSAFSGCTEIDTLNYNAINCADFTNYYTYHPFNNLNISTINIGDSVQRIPAYFAYGLQKLSSVTIPISVISVGTQAFYNCPIIESVTCLPTTPPSTPSTPSTGDMALFNTNVYIHSPLYVPMGTEKLYMYDQGWGQFINVIGIKTQDDVLATDIMLDRSVMSLILGTSSQLVATVLPDSTTNMAVAWASSNPNVATVDEDGVVTAMGLGNALITAVTTDGSNLSATCRVIVTSMSTTNGFAVADAEVMHGKEIVIPVAMNNDQTILAFQTDIYLPEGFGIVMDEDDEYMISPSNRLTEDHILMANEGNGAVSVVCYTPEGRPIGGNSGDDLFYITVQVPENASGDYAIYLRNSRVTTADYTELRVPDVGAVVTVKSFIPGDANDSRTVTVTDIVVTAQYVLQMNPEPFVFEAADMNGDGEVTVTDIMLIAHLINHPTMNAPKRMSALEGGNDSMSGEDVTLMADETRKVSIQLNNEMDYTAFQLDLTLPAGLIASNIQLTDRAGNHAFDVSTLSNGKTRVLCYSPAIEVINGHEGVLLTFDVKATDDIEGIITVDGIELVTADCQTVLMNSFTIGVNSATRVNELNGAKTVARVDYFNLAGQQIDRPSSGVTLVVTTYTDGTRSTTKVIK